MKPASGARRFVASLFAAIVAVVVAIGPSAAPAAFIVGPHAGPYIIGPFQLPGFGSYSQGSITTPAPVSTSTAPPIANQNQPQLVQTTNSGTPATVSQGNTGHATISSPATFANAPVAGDLLICAVGVSNNLNMTPAAPPIGWKLLTPAGTYLLPNQPGMLAQPNIWAYVRTTTSQDIGGPYSFAFNLPQTGNNAVSYPAAATEQCEEWTNTASAQAIDSYSPGLAPAARPGIPASLSQTSPPILMTQSNDVLVNFFAANAEGVTAAPGNGYAQLDATGTTGGYAAPITMLSQTGIAPNLGSVAGIPLTITAPNAGTLKTASLAIALNAATTAGTGGNFIVERAVQSYLVGDGAGMNFHWDHGNYGYGSTANFAGAETLARLMRVRHYRGGVINEQNNTTDVGNANIATLEANLGGGADVSLLANAGDTPATMQSAIGAGLYRRVIDRESINEPDDGAGCVSSWISQTQTTLGQLQQAQTADGRGTVGPSLTQACSYFSSSQVAVEQGLGSILGLVFPVVGNLHNYPANGLPGGRGVGFGLLCDGVSSQRGDQCLVSYTVGDGPIQSTEYGYGSQGTFQGSNACPAVQMNDGAIGKYVRRALREQYMRGIFRTYFDEFLDGGGGAFNCFGFVRDDPTTPGGGTYTYTPKHQYFALQGDQILTGDTTPYFTPQTLRFRIDTLNPLIHHLLRQKSDGSFHLDLWQETASGNPLNTAASPAPSNIGNAIAVTPISTTVTFGSDVTLTGTTVTSADETSTDPTPPPAPGATAAPGQAVPASCPTLPASTSYYGCPGVPVSPTISGQAVPVTITDGMTTVDIPNPYVMKPVVTASPSPLPS